MPTVRMNDENEGEGVTGAGTTGTGATREVSRVTSNITLADHIGKFVAGEVSHKFAAENLAEGQERDSRVRILGLIEV